MGYESVWGGIGSGMRIILLSSALGASWHAPGSVSAADPLSGGSAKNAVFVGQISGTDARMALVLAGNRATAFIAGDSQTLESLSGWFEGSVSAGSLKLTDAAGASGGHGRLLSGRLSATSAGGKLRLEDGRQLSWSATPADPRTGAGMYLYTDENALTGAIVDNAQKMFAVSRSLKTGRIGRPNLPARTPTGDILKVSIQGPNRGQTIPIDLFRIRLPLQGLIHIFAYRPFAVDAAVKQSFPALDAFGNLINPFDVTVVENPTDDQADIILVSDRNTHTIFAFDPCETNVPTIPISASGVFDNLRDISQGAEGLFASNTVELFNFEAGDPVPTFFIPGFGVCTDISYKPANGNFVVLDALDRTDSGDRFDALLEVAPDGSNAIEIKNPLALSDADRNINGRLYLSAIAFGSEYLVAWSSRLGTGIDRVTADGQQFTFAHPGANDGFQGTPVPTDMVLFDGDVVVAAVGSAVPGGSALYRIGAFSGEVSILISDVGLHPNGLTVETHAGDSHIIVADFHPPPPDAAHGGTDDPVGGQIIRVFPNEDAQLAHNTRVVQCQAGF